MRDKYQLITLCVIYQTCEFDLHSKSYDLVILFFLSPRYKNDFLGVIRDERAKIELHTEFLRIALISTTAFTHVFHDPISQSRDILFNCLFRPIIDLGNRDLNRCLQFAVIQKCL